ncbi:hypothetical protein [Janthinobacterium sp. B9-8]|uniref:hypothetical protein n=1 Tax=Janthinobacterium sp. B9-8 TaxID=1236179 RepID=UPI00061CF36C|nr:hypothetical protein [Janthinobacterium sp. B9-8]AMC34020.1 hypothetical protein VN23_05135 [Janthinobacterium sp. B9-8]
MPIEIHIKSSVLHVQQSFISPTVYLDHWAIRLFSEDIALQNRFVSALNNKKGTLLISTFSLSEFSSSNNSRHAIDAESFIERLLPNIFLTDFALNKIIDRERAETNNIKRFWPPADLPQLIFLIQNSPHNKLTFSGFITLAHIYRDEILEEQRALVLQIKEKIEMCRSSPSSIKQAKNNKPDNNLPRTIIILDELLRGYYLDLTAPITNNDIIDLLHAMIPINCCDFVLLDGAWEQRVQRMKHRIANAGLDLPLAECFSRRKDGIYAFLNKLEAFDKNSQTNIAIP